MPITTGGHDYRIPLSPGYADSDVLTGVAFSLLGSPVGTQDDQPLAAVPSANMGMPHGSTTFWMIGLVGLAVGLHLVHRMARKKADKPISGIEDELGINLWNLINVTVLASVGILTAKVGINKWAAGTTVASIVNAI